MNYEDYFKKEIKNFNINFLSEELRSFEPKISGNFLKDKGYKIVTNWQECNKKSIFLFACNKGLRSFFSSLICSK